MSEQRNESSVAYALITTSHADLLGEYATRGEAEEAAERLRELGEGVTIIECDDDPTPSAATMPSMTPEGERELREWVLSRPSSIQEAMRKFPPACTVRATVPLGIPAPGCVGQVVSYIEPSEDGRTGVRVRGRWSGTGPFMDAHCNLDELELVEEGVVTCALIDAILQGPDA